MRFIPSQPGTWVADDVSLPNMQLAIQVCVDAEREGPSADQWAFFVELDGRYPDLIRTSPSRQQFRHDLPVDVRQAERPALELERQLRVVEPQQVQ